MKKIMLIGGFLCFFMLIFSFFELSENNNYEVNSSLIGLTIDGISMTTFPTKDSGYTIDSIKCDKGATGVWDYENWGLKIRNMTQSRTKCQINFVSKYTENILNGADPVLKEGLIPVIIENDGTVKKASLGWEWYKYETQRWANAVILNNETEIYYDGDTIPESAIESYFVWIPRYKYKIFDMGIYEKLTTIENKPKIIEVVFGTDTTTDTSSSCASPLVSGASGTCSVGKYMTHPAFISFDSIGMWVGKFETGYKGASTTTEAEKNENNPSKIQIKPDVYSWRNIQVANAYFSSYNYKRDYNSHMMKNTEWGAVAYLQHSQYGSHTSLRVNNNSDYKTGYAGVHEPTIGFTGTNISCSSNPDACNEYGTNNNITRLWNTDIGYLASTTGNISGIYDMSGGAWENVMGVMLNENEIPCSGKDINGNSGFNGPYCNVGQTGNLSTGLSFPNDSRYYDKYEYSTLSETYNRRILGDATGEIGPFTSRTYGSIVRDVGSWYEDEGWFVWSRDSWFVRGVTDITMEKDQSIFSHQYGQTRNNFKMMV